MNPLATEISRLVGNTKDVAFRIGKAVDTATVQLHNGTNVQVSKWAWYPGNGYPVLVLIFKGTVIGIGLTDQYSQAIWTSDGGTVDMGQYGMGLFDYLDASTFSSGPQLMSGLDVNYDCIRYMGPPTAYDHGHYATPKSYCDGKDLTPDFFKFYNDFVWNPMSTTYADNNLANYGAGTGAGSSARQGYTNRLGVCRFNTGSTATGYMAPSTVFANITIASTTQFWTYEGDFYILDLSTAVEEFNCKMGFYDNSTVPTKGIFFLYDRAGGVMGGAASANWKCVVAGAANTVNVTTVAVPAATWFRLKITVDCYYNPPKVTFYINGTSVYSTQTNVPSGTAYGLYFGLAIIKTVGVTARNLDCDWLKVAATQINR